MGGLAGVMSVDKPLPKLALLLLETMHRGWDIVGLSAVISNSNAKRFAVKYYDGGSWYKTLTTILRASSSKTQPRIASGLGYVGENYLITQPSLAETDGDGGFKISVAIDGGVLNLNELAREMRVKEGRNESETIARILLALAVEEKRDVVEALKRFLELAVGGFSIAVMTSEPRLIAAKDPQGLKPLSYSFNGEEFYIASESSALETLRLEWREVKPGQVVSFDGSSLDETLVSPLEPTPCAFEYVYISRPDSVFSGVSVYSAKFNMGRETARIAETRANAVVPLPESGRIAALGYSRESGIPLEEAIYTVRYVGRSFLAPRDVRGLIAEVKYGIVRSKIEDKSIILVDDSIVRGTTMRRIVNRLKQKGAREVHLRIASPRFSHACPISSELSASELASRSSSFETEIGADSLVHNTVEGLKRAIGLDSSICVACFTGVCPLKRSPEFWWRGVLK